MGACPLRLSAQAAAAGRLIGEAIGRGDQLVRDAWFEGGVAGVGDYAQLSSRPGAVKFPGNLGWAEHVVAAVDDNRGDVTDATDVLQQLVVRPHEPSVQEVVALDPGESSGVFRLFERGDRSWVRLQVNGGAFLG